MNRLFRNYVTFLIIGSTAMDYDQLIKRMDSHTQLLKEILEQLKRMGNDSMTNSLLRDLSQDLIDNVDVRSMLNISHSTLLRIKKNKLITPIRIGTRDYYSLSEIRSMVNRFKK